MCVVLDVTSGINDKTNEIKKVLFSLIRQEKINNWEFFFFIKSEGKRY